MAQTRITARASYAGPTDTRGARVTVRTGDHSRTASRDYATDYADQARELASDLVARVYGLVTLTGETSTPSGDRYAYTFARVTA